MIAKRVVITGLGAITPLGNTVSETWQNLIDGVCGIDQITKLDPQDLPSTLAGEVKNFDPNAYLPRKEARRVGPFTQYAFASTLQALQQAQLDLSSLDPTRIGLDISSALGGVPSIYEQSLILQEHGPRRVNPSLIPATLINMVPSFIAIKLNIQGPVLSTVSACATGISAIGEAARRIAWGETDVIIAGATDSILTPLAFIGFGRIGALSTRNDTPQQALTPFDAQRDGTVLGEGAAVVVLESLEHAQARQAPILAEILGYAMTIDAYHIAAPDPAGNGASRAMSLALERANCQPETIDYISAHGTGTQLNDLSETKAVKQSFASAAYNIPLSSIKSMTGHMMGASAALSCVATVMALQKGILPPTIGLHKPDPDCDLDYIPQQARQANIQRAMVNAFGFGGQNASLILSRFG